MTGMPQNDSASTFLSFAAKRMQHSVNDIYACLDRLTDEQIWHRGGEYENSIANLLLHLAGNLRQWVLHGIGGRPDVRRRDEEFTLQTSMSAAEARSLFTEVVDKAGRIIATLPPERLLEVIDPQPGTTWSRVTVLEAIFLVTAHLQEHKGQIVLLTKQLTRSDLDLSLPRKR